MIDVGDIPAVVIEEFFELKETNPAKAMRILLEHCEYDCSNLTFKELCNLSTELMQELSGDVKNPLPKSSASTRKRRGSRSRR